MEDNVYGSIQEGGSSVPTFLLKLVSMLDDGSNHDFVDWSSAGTSFIVKDQVQFSKIVLPRYFKHNKFASFVRQLNMYGFRKITSLTQSSLNSEREEVEFYHYLFIRGEKHLLEKIKRKVNKPDPSRPSEDVSKVLADVKQMQNYQEGMNSKLVELKHENEDLWREVVNLRQKHAHQQKVVNKLIQFLVNLVHQTGMGVKRKLPLMIEDGSSESTSHPPAPKYSKPVYLGEEPPPLALEQSDQPTVSFPSSEALSPEDNNNMGTTSGHGPLITEVTTQPQQGNLTEVFPAGSVPVLDLDGARNIGLMSPVRGEDKVAWGSSPQHDPDNWVQSYGKSDSGLTGHATQPLQQETVPSEIMLYEPPPRRISTTELNSHVDSVQNNLETIQDMLFNNDQVELDYGLIQELFGTSPDIMPPADIVPTGTSMTPVTGNELVLRSDKKLDDDAA